MAEKENESLPETLRHLAIIALIAAFISAIISFAVSFLTVVLLIIAAVLFVFGLILYFLSRKMQDRT